MNSPAQRLSRVLAIDSGSPVVSVALGDHERVLATRSMAIAHSSEELLGAVDEVLQEAGMTIGEVDGLLALRGPGSFTGLRVGLATVLGLHQALAVPATALPTLEILTLAAPASARRVLAVVNAMRGEWFYQLSIDGRAQGRAEIAGPDALAALEPEVVVGHGLDALGQALPDVERAAAGELAPLALHHAGPPTFDWDAARLLEPLYLRPPAIHGRG